MPEHRGIKYSMIVAVFLIQQGLASGQSTRSLVVQKDLVSDTLVEVAWNDCDALIVLSKNQCSNCSKNMGDLIDLLDGQGYRASFARVVDVSLMDCKVDEILIQDYNSELAFYYLPEMKVEFTGTGLQNDETHFECTSTPVLLIRREDKMMLIPSDEVVDDYGRLKLTRKSIQHCKSGTR